MNSSDNKKQSNKKRKGKVQLQQDLPDANNSLKQQKLEHSEYQKELELVKKKIANLEEMKAQFSVTEKEVQQLNVNLKSFSQKSDLLEQEIEKLKQTNQKLEEDFKILKRQIDVVEENNTKYIEKVNKDQIKTITQRQNSENETRELFNKSNQHNQAKPEKKLPEFHSESEDSGDEIRATPLQYLPANDDDEESIPEIESIEVGQRIPSKVVNRVIEEVKIQQSNQFLNNNKSVCSQLPFSVYSRLRLPIMPSIENTDIDTPSYGMRLVISEAKSDNHIFDKEFAEELIFGVTEYENNVSLPMLEPGTYNVNVYAIVPFIHIGEQKSLTIKVN